MEQLIKKESQKIIDQQVRQARIQRQKQVRQQAMAWTDATRKRFEDAKELGIRTLALTVTDQVQQAAIENIKLLTTQNDLALAEIGMAHRNAAGMQQVEKLKSLKRLRNQEVAKNRGSEAMAKLLKVKETESAKSLAILKRKEEVRKAEDKKSNELISRRPLKVQNSDVDKRLQDSKKLRPPKYQQSLAKTLRVPSTSSQGGRVAKSPSPTKSRLPPHTVEIPGSNRPPRTEKNYVVKKTSSIEMFERRRTEAQARGEKIPGGGGGVLPKMVRIHTGGFGLEPSVNSHVAASGFGQEPSDNSRVADLATTALPLRKKYMSAINPPPVKQDNKTSAVRYYDVAIPKGEVKYIAPEGLTVKEVRNSPDAWVKGRASSATAQAERDMRLQNDEEMQKRAEERGKNALKKAKLEKQLTEVKNELLREIDQEILGGGSQEAFLGLADTTDVESPGRMSMSLEEKRAGSSSDEFSAVESDEEDFFPKGNTMKKYKVTEDERDKHIALVPTAADGGSDSNNINSEEKRHSSLDSYSSYSSPSSARSVDDLPLDKKPHEAESPPTATGKAQTAEPSKKGASKGKGPTPPQKIPNLEEYDSLSLSDDDDDLNRKNGSRRRAKKKSNDSSVSSSSSKKDRTSTSTGKASSSSRSTLAEINVVIPENYENSQNSSSGSGALRDVPDDGSKPSGSGGREKGRRSSEESNSRRELEKPSKKEPKAHRGGEKAKKTEQMYSSTDSVGSLGSHRGSSDNKKKRSSSSSKDNRSSISSEERTKSNSSNSTVAEVKIFSESVESRGSSLEDLQARAEEQERLLRGDGSRTQLPVEVTLKVRKSKGSSPPASGSENTSISTDYYNLPEGPYTSTPDGKLQPKRGSKPDTGEEVGKRALKNVLQKFLTRKPSSIENLPVSSSSSSLVQIDAELLSENLGDSSVEKSSISSSSGHSSRTGSASTSSPSNDSMNIAWKNKKGPLSTLSEESGEGESGSTVAEVPKVVINLNSSSEHSSNGDVLSYNSGSIHGMLIALNSNQEIDMHLEQSGIEDILTSPSDISSSRNQTSDRSGPSPHSTLRTSSDAINESTLYLSRILQRQRRRSRSGSVSASGGESSSKSGPDREAKRVEELLEDVTPVKLLDSPPVKRAPSNGNEAEQLSSVFENLISKWSQIKIDPPPPWIGGGSNNN